MRPGGIRRPSGAGRSARDALWTSQAGDASLIEIFDAKAQRRKVKTSRRDGAAAQLSDHSTENGYSRIALPLRLRIFASKIFDEMTTAPMTGKVAVITGGSGGIGSA